MTRFTIKVPKGKARSGTHKAPLARLGGPHRATPRAYQPLPAAFLRRVGATEE